MSDPWQAVFTVAELEHLADLFAGANDETSAAIGVKAQAILESIGAREPLNPAGAPSTLSRLATMLAVADPTAQPLIIETSRRER